MNKILLIIFSIGFFLLLIILILWLFRKTSINIPTTTTSPTVTLVPTPTPNTTDLFISELLPPQDSKEPYLTIQKVTISFSEEVDPIALKYKISPKTEVIIRGDITKKKIYIIPRTKWELGKTTITILQSTISTRGKALYLPFTYNLTTDIPKSPEGEGELP